MRPKDLLAECETLAARLGMNVRRASGVHSAFCVVRGENIIYLDAGDDDDTHFRVFLDAFATVDCDTVFISPALRERIDDQGGTAGT